MSANADETLPPPDFTTFVLSLSTSALLHLGESVPNAPPAALNLPLARHTIDLLGMIEQKTHGNLTGNEEQLLTQVLYDLRIRFVQKSKP